LMRVICTVYLEKQAGLHAGPHSNAAESRLVS
jgi:hypothetical protein